MRCGKSCQSLKFLNINLFNLKVLVVHVKQQFAENSAYMQ